MDDKVMAIGACEMAETRCENAEKIIEQFMAKKAQEVELVVELMGRGN